MNKKRFLIIAIVLFLFIGTGTFVFANPSEEDYSLDENLDSGEIQTTKKKTDIENDKDLEDDSIESSNTLDSEVIEPITDNTLNAFSNWSSANRKSASLGASGLNINPLPPTNNNQDMSGINNGNQGGNSVDNGSGNNNGGSTTNPGTGGDSGSIVIPPTEGEDSKDPNPGDSKTEEEKQEEAKKAVEEAEKSQNRDDINHALDLIKDIEDEEVRKELEDRLNALLKLLEIKDLVKELANKVNNAQNKNDIEDARKYRDEQNIVSLVDSLPESIDKEELLKELNELSKILDDVEAPKINGIEKEFVNHEVNITIENEDITKLKIVVNDKTVSMDELNGLINKEGTYHIVVIDAAFNQTEITFTVDKTKPVLLNPKEYYGINDEVKLEFSDQTKTTIHLKKDNQDIPYKSGEVITEEGKYTVYAVDEAGNASDVYTFVVDKTKPVLLNHKEYYGINDEVKLEFSDQTKTTIHLKKENQGIPYQTGEIITEEGKYTVYAVDEAGNTSDVYTFVVDKTKPFYKEFKIENVSNSGSKTAKLGDEIKVSITFNEELVESPTIHINNTILLKGILDQTNNTYFVLYTIDENTSDGEMLVQVSNYKDIANNLGDEFNNSSFTEENKLIVEKEQKEPEENEDGYFKFVNNASFATKNIKVNLNEYPTYHHMIVTDAFGKQETVNSIEHTLKSNKNTIYTFDLRDINDQTIKYVKMYFDNEKPEYDVISKKNNETINFVDGEVYHSVLLTFKDKDLAKVEVYKDNNLFTIKEIGKYDDERDSYTLETFTDKGNYKIVVNDRAGNETVVTFKIESAKFSLRNMFKSITNLFSF